jgi:hypothetical protein
MARAVVVGIAHARWKAAKKNAGDSEDKLHKLYKQLARPKWPASQLKAAYELTNRAGLDHHVSGRVLEKIAKIQSVVGSETQLKLIWSGTGDIGENDIVVFAGAAAPLIVYIYFSQGRFRPITTMTMFTGRSYYCTTCDKGRNRWVHPRVCEPTNIALSKVSLL